MNMMDVLVVRIYLSEHSKQQETLFRYLKDDAKVRGVTVFRAIHGFGSSKHEKQAFMVDMSLDLPIVVEFFDETTKVEAIMEHLTSLVKSQHMICWPAKVIIDS